MKQLEELTKTTTSRNDKKEIEELKKEIKRLEIKRLKEDVTFEVKIRNYAVNLLVTLGIFWAWLIIIIALIPILMLI